MAESSEIRDQFKHWGENFVNTTFLDSHIVSCSSKGVRVVQLIAARVGGSFSSSVAVTVRSPNHV